MKIPFCSLEEPGVLTDMGPIHWMRNKMVAWYLFIEDFTDEEFVKGGSV